MDPDTRSSMREAGRIGAVGMEFAGAVIGCLVIGYWADKKLGTSPWLSGLGILIGSFAGFMAVYRALKVMQRQNEDEEKRQKEER